MKRNTMTGALLLLLTVLQTACGTAAEDSGEAVSGDTGSAADTAAVITESAELRDSVPALDFGGKSYDILTCGNWDAEWTECYEFLAEEENGEPVNDAVYARNLAMEERFNVKIVEDYNKGSALGGTGKGAKMVKNSVMASDCAYDIILMGTYDCGTLAAEGFLMELTSEVPYLDLNQPWWDQNALADLALGNKVYYVTGDITTIDNDCTFCLLFNKSIIADYDLEDPYAHVLEGTWTIDKFIEMASQVSGDLNGDSVYDQNDLYGYCIWHEAMRGMVSACGGRFGAVNENGELELTLNTERTINMLTRFMDLAYDRTLSYSIYHNEDAIESMFANDQVLFYSRYLAIIKKYRNMETDFGILPYPKYDEAQTEYYSSVSPYGCSFICVPTVVEDVEMTGAVIEAMACESMYTVTPAYYDITLEGKMLRDNESTEMLDIILGNRVFDLGWIYEIGKYHTGVLELFYKSNRDFASMYEKNEPAALKKIAEINETFK